MPIKFFHIVLKYLLDKYEGVYSNDKDDPGKETFKGISRANFPHLSLWNIIDSLKDDPDFYSLISNNKTLANLISDFYYYHFWQPLHCDSLPQVIAAELFESAVHNGIVPVIMFFQRTLNILNKNEIRYKDIKVDGLFGPETLKISLFYFKHFSFELFFKVLNIYQGAHYISLIEKNKSFEKYQGFFNRVTFNSNFIYQQ